MITEFPCVTEIAPLSLLVFISHFQGHLTGLGFDSPLKREGRKGKNREGLSMLWDFVLSSSSNAEQIVMRTRECLTLRFPMLGILMGLCYSAALILKILGYFRVV